MPKSLAPLDTFVHRHVGPAEDDVAAMLETVGFDSLSALCNAVVPESIRVREALDLPAPRGEREVLDELHALAEHNQVHKSYIGMGYHGTVVPAVIQRNVLENPGWYTQYTPYQAEISQGRLEALLNFQTMIADLTGLPVANSSLLDEGTAAAEALALCHGASRKKRSAYFVADDCHPQTLDVVRTRAAVLGIEVHVGDPATFDFDANAVAGALVQYPTTDGRVLDYEALAGRVHDSGALLVVAADPLALTLLRAPGEFGADLAVGSTQRFGVPMGYGGPHAAYMAAAEEHKRLVPGRIIGLSKDTRGRPALRLALQTREQHIRREKATSNICTAQVLLAIMASMYAVYHGPQGLTRIAARVRRATYMLREGLRRLGYDVSDGPVFDTITVPTGTRTAEEILAIAYDAGINLRPMGERLVGVSLDETVTVEDLQDLLEVFSGPTDLPFSLEDLDAAVEPAYSDRLRRKTEFLTHPVFRSHHSETEMLRYITTLQNRDLSLAHSMISLGSCTMKLNGTSEMVPVTWPEFGNLHPFAPLGQTQGYQEMFRRLERQLAVITGFAAVSLQPNAGSQGEYAGLLVIRAYHDSRGQGHRNVCLIPTSAHGTNPASAVMAGMKVVLVDCDERGNIDVDHLRSQVAKHAENLGALMVTYPSTHGVFEADIREICEVVHGAGGQIYMDGANMNAQVGLTNPGAIGADVCHLNLHKTFCIPHGGGGPGMGPICVAEHLAPFLPGHAVVATGGDRAIGAISAAPWGSPSILPISHVYIELMGGTGLTRATQVAILNANYMAKRLEEHYDVLYRGTSGLVAHEFILDFRHFPKEAHVGVEDVAKRLMDYGFHAPTMSFPVAGTLMIEPTESESLAELDRFCDALIAIRAEIQKVADGEWPADDNPLVNAPHTADQVTADEWTHPYGRQTAAYPAPWVAANKFWPYVSRVDNLHGDRNLICTCPPIEDYAE